MRRVVWCFALLLCFSPLALAQEASTSPGVSISAESSTPPLSNMLSIAQSLKDDSTTLRQRLETRKTQAQAQVESWQNIVAQLRSENENDKKQSAESSEKLAKAKAELKKSQADLAAISKLLDASKQDTANLSMDFENYKHLAEAEMRSKVRELWLWRAATALAVLFGGYEAGRAQGWFK
jgi:chromosome segregation ATPase